MPSPFETLSAINCNGHTEKKNGLTYLSWAWAWAELKKRYPASYYTIYETADGMFYHTDGKTCWVKTGVTLVDSEYSLEHIEYLPVMDYKNKSITKNDVTSFDVNKAIQRSLTKATARHGLGLYIYAGEDLPEGEPQETPKPSAPALTPVAESGMNPPVCCDCLCLIEGYGKKTPQEMAKYTKGKYGRALCADCATEAAKAKSDEGAAS